VIKKPGALEWAFREYTQKAARPPAGGATGTNFLSYASILPADKKATFTAHLLKLIDEYVNSSNSSLR
jgi:choline dehydrogenase